MTTAFPGRHDRVDHDRAVRRHDGCRADIARSGSRAVDDPRRAGQARFTFAPFRASIDALASDRAMAITRVAETTARWPRSRPRCALARGIEPRRGADRLHATLIAIAAAIDAGSRTTGRRRDRRPSSSDWAPNRYPVPKPSRKAAKSEGRIRVGQALDSAQLQQVERDFGRRLRPLTSAGPAIVA
jgi:hypothetical protein